MTRGRYSREQRRRLLAAVQPQLDPTAALEFAQGAVLEYECFASDRDLEGVRSEVEDVVGTLENFAAARVFPGGRSRRGKLQHVAPGRGGLPDEEGLLVRARAVGERLGGQLDRDEPLSVLDVLELRKLLLRLQSVDVVDVETLPHRNCPDAAGRCLEPVPDEEKCR